MQVNKYLTYFHKISMGRMFRSGALFALFLMISEAAVAENTGINDISRVQFQGVGKTLYIVAEDNAWDAPSCSGAKFVRVLSSLPGRDEMVSIVLAAFAAGKQVNFQGTCYSSNYFDADYITVYK